MSTFFLSPTENPLELNTRRRYCFSRYLRWPQGSLWLATTWRDGDKYATLFGNNEVKCNHGWGSGRCSDWARKQNKTKQKNLRQEAAGYPFRLFARHLLHMIIITEWSTGGLSWPHLYQQAGIKLSNYPPRPLAPWPPDLPSHLLNWPAAKLCRLLCESTS